MRNEIINSTKSHEYVKYRLRLCKNSKIHKLTMEGRVRVKLCTVNYLSLPSSLFFRSTTKESGVKKITETSNFDEN